MRSLVARIRERQGDGLMPVIARIAVRDPREGELLRGRDPGAVAAMLDDTGIAGICVVTGPADFGGGVELIRPVRRATDLPVVWRDDPEGPADLDESARAGADAVVLTVRGLAPRVLAAMQAHASALGLETILEVGSAADLAIIADLGLAPHLVAIRDDGDDDARTRTLARAVPPACPVIGGHAVDTASDVLRAHEAGVDAVLTGAAIMRAADPTALIAELVGVGRPETRPAGGASARPDRRTSGT